ncbi:unnamed protein product [Caenorhabditis auriculariae]|uniref:Uncharacterized protein n=1 Tax=Caenorhabditis auriculariae TaxID=2777116 RepID=A0A8S1HAL4_9PELO|nr:unnamed protein product [Caenorhabditis auriculariae]
MSDKAATHLKFNELVEHYRATVTPAVTSLPLLIFKCWGSSINWSQVPSGVWRKIQNLMGVGYFIKKRSYAMCSSHE